MFKEQKDTQQNVVQKYKVQFSADPELIQGIERSKELLSNKLGAAPSMEDVFKVIVNEYIEQNTPKEKAIKIISKKASKTKDALTGKQAQKRTRFIPKKVKELIQVRDGMCCSYTSKDGTRCNSKVLLHIDHIRPYAKGGGNEADNLRLLCYHHNRLEAEKEFGISHMSKFK